MRRFVQRQPEPFRDKAAPFDPFACKNRGHRVVPDQHRPGPARRRRQPIDLGPVGVRQAGQPPPRRNHRPAGTIGAEDEPPVPNRLDAGRQRQRRNVSAAKFAGLAHQPRRRTDSLDARPAQGRCEILTRLQSRHQGLQPRTPRRRRSAADADQSRRQRPRAHVPVHTHHGLAVDDRSRAGFRRRLIDRLRRRARQRLPRPAAAEAGIGVGGIFDPVRPLARQPVPQGPARRSPSSGRNSIRPRPSGQAGDGDHSRTRPRVEPSLRIRSASAMSSAVWANRTTDAPASRAASAIKPCRAARAAAVSPVAGLSPFQLNPRQSAPAFRAAPAAKSVQRPLSAFSR
jgi:hypothetical protein